MGLRGDERSAIEVGSVSREHEKACSSSIAGFGRGQVTGKIGFEV